METIFLALYILFLYTLVQLGYSVLFLFMKHCVCDDIDINNPCAVRNGECSHFCLLSNNQEGYSCSCPEGLILQRNRTCEGLHI